MESKELTIVIVTLKSENKILKCLESISNEIPVIVVLKAILNWSVADTVAEIFESPTIFSMSPPLRCLKLNSLAKPSATVVFPIAGGPEIITDLNKLS